ncbi:MAG: beta-ketoacyl-ACP synthase III, partial [Sphingomonadaceae bacterium]
DLAVEAAERALLASGHGPESIDLIVLATATPDRTFPATAADVQRRLGVRQGAAFDVAAVCSGFIYALTIADALLKTGLHHRALVIGAETFSRILDWDDRATAVLFGDGAGAVVLEARDEPDSPAARGILCSRLHADGRHAELLYVDGGPGSTGTVGKLRMSGREVFRHAVVNLAAVVEEVLDAAGVARPEIDWVVPHQANARIIEATARKLGLPMERVVMTVGEHANTSAASVPLAFDAAVRDGRIQPGHLCLLEAMGGGFTWGAVLLRA